MGVLSAAALFALRRSAADVRYVVAAIGLSLMLTMPVVTALAGLASMTSDAGASAELTSALTAAESVLARDAALQSRLVPERRHAGADWPAGGACGIRGPRVIAGDVASVLMLVALAVGRARF